MSDDRLIRSLERLAKILARLERQVANDEQISLAQLRILVQLGADGSGLHVSDLAAAQGVALSTMTRNLAQVEKLGWVQRAEAPEDRRCVQITLTSEGAERARGIRQRQVAAYAQALQSFHPSDRVERAVALDRVAAALEKIV